MNDKKENASIKRVPVTLKDTAELMLSEDYNERFLAEYRQLEIRENKLRKLTEQWDSGTIDFDPTCPRSIYNLQLEYMEKYRSILEARAKMEGIF